MNDAMQDDYLEVQLRVPADRVADFYRLYADWLDAGSPVEEAPIVSRHELKQSAIRWLRSLKTRERAVWDLWIDAAPQTVSAQSIVDALQLKSAGSIPGLLRWSGHKGAKVGFPVWWNFQAGEGPSNTAYGLGGRNGVIPKVGMTVSEYGELLKEVKREVNE